MQAAVSLQNAREREVLIRTRENLTEQVTRGVQIIARARPSSLCGRRSAVSRRRTSPCLSSAKAAQERKSSAQALHYQGPRGNRPFVRRQLRGPDESLLENELFGPRARRLTDAREARQGNFELADGGTLFLDEIGDMSLGGQAKLLRVLEQKLCDARRRLAGDSGQRADRRSHERQSDGGRPQQEIPRRPLLPAARGAPRAPAAGATAPKTSCRWPSTSSNSSPPRRAGPRCTCPPKPGGDFSRTTGPATSASCATSWSTSRSSRPARRSKPKTSISSPRPTAKGRSDPFARHGARRRHEPLSSRIHPQGPQAVGGNMSEAARLMGLHRSNLYRKMHSSAWMKRGT